MKIVIGCCTIAACAVAGIYGTEAILSRGADAAAEARERPSAMPVAVAKPEASRIDEEVSAVGTLRAARAIDVVPNVAGRVVEIAVGSGERVEGNQLLIQLDDRAERAAVADAEATLRETRREYERFQRLEESNSAAPARLEEARAAFLRAEAALMRAEAALTDRAITAPFAGTLGLMDLDEGAFLNAGTPVTRLSDLSRVEVTTTLPERYYERVWPGQTLEITTPAYPGETFEARVTLRAPEIDRATRSFEIRAEIDNADRRLVGGMFASTRLTLDRYEGIAIPDDAVISEGLATYVFTVNDGIAARTEVELGRSLGPLTEVREGLAPEDRVVVAGWDNLTDGASVEVREDVPEDALQ
jgi:membrane fusion protein (multidrug efflux system)